MTNTGETGTAMLDGRRFGIVLFLLALLFSGRAAAEGVSVGLSLEFIDQASTEAVDGGFGLQAGYEFRATENWDYGVEFHYFDGWTKESELNDEFDLMFRSFGLSATARPHNWPLTFRAGVVNASYKTIYTSQSDTGYSYGFGLVIGEGNVRLHLLDYDRYKIGSESFNSYAISLMLFGY